MTDKSLNYQHVRENGATQCFYLERELTLESTYKGIIMRAVRAKNCYNNNNKILKYTSSEIYYLMENKAI